MTDDELEELANKTTDEIDATREALDPDSQINYLDLIADHCRTQIATIKEFYA